MRVVSLLPSATEIVAALGQRDCLVGVTHECDYPDGVERLPHLTANLLDPGMSSREIDVAVSASLTTDAHTIYGLNVDLLAELEPDLIFTQALCEVCAVPTSMVEDAVCTLPKGARVVSLDPLTLDAVFDSLELAAAELGVPHRGRSSAVELRAEIDSIRDAVAGRERRRVLAAEWLDPVYCGGHWVPEMIETAGGSDPFGTVGQPSHRLAWADIVAADPDVIVLMPCGYYAPQVAERYHELAAAKEWSTLRAVRDGAVFAVDATSYYSRPGPRLVDGVRILARILHPTAVSEPLPDGGALKLTDGEFQPYR